MTKSILGFILLLLLCSCSKGVYVVKAPFKSSPVPPPPNYSQPSHWASLPNKLDAADSIPLKSNLKDLQASAKADVFFVHPTIFTGAPKNQFQWNADVNDDDLNREIQLSTILNQASIFNGACRIYAPYYRQAHLYAFYTPNKEESAEALNLAYHDVKTAFEYYLENYNQGRPIIIASHSQGSYHCERLLKDYFDGTELKNRLVVAYLVGRAILPDAFTSIKPTQRQDELGVWASWNTYARGFYPKNYEQYFKRSLSTNPLLWNSTEEFARKELNHGGVERHFTFAAQLVDAQNHQGMLWVNKPYVRGRLFVHTKRWHVADMNFFYVNIRENAALRIEKYLEQQRTQATGKSD